MGRIEDLYTLVRLLKEFNLPVSPILEYAIKSKEEELIQAATEHSVIEPVPLDESEDESPITSIEKISLIIGNTVRNQRKGKGMSMKELSIKAGVSYNTILNLENGHCLPSFYVLSTVLDALDLVIRFIAKSSNAVSELLTEVTIDRARIDIGDVIRERRKEKGLSKEVLARKAEVSYNTILNMENGKHLPSFGVISKVLDVIGLEIRIAEYNRQ